ncbi:glycosyltransferase [Robertmurraya sp. GLU-23]
MRVILFGTGQGAEIVYKSIDKKKVSIVCFLDNNKKKQGTQIHGYNIDIPEEVNKYPYDYIIIASQYVKEIKGQLLSLDINENKIIAFFDIYNSNSYQKFNQYLDEGLFDIKSIIKIYFPNISHFVKRSFVINNQNPNQLIFNHLYGGGTQVYQDKYIKSILKSTNVILAHVIFNHLVLVYKDYEHKEVQCIYIKLCELNQKEFNDYLHRIGISLIYINQFVSFPVEIIIRLIKDSGVPYIFFLHDYFCVCPSYNLINSSGVYCEAENNEDLCQKCIRSNLITEEAIRLDRNAIHIGNWRTNFHEFLKKASGIFAPSESTKKILLSYYPDININVIEHQLDLDVKKTFNPAFIYEEYLNVAFLGNINNIKGSKIIYELKDLIKRDNTPIKLKVIGTTEVHNRYFLSEDEILEVHGPYDREIISELLEKKKVSIVIIPTLSPETYNYTTSEAMESGYPVITFSIGAPAERVLRTGGGWVIKQRDAESIYRLLRDLSKDRDSILQKSKCL